MKEKLAINGGKPVREKFLPYGKQFIDDDDINAVIEVLKSDYLTTGPKILDFEKKVAEYTGAKYAVAVANGTAALHLACLAAEIGGGDEVITTPMTFAASANSILYCKGKPVFADINPDNFNIDVEDIERKINGKTKAIIPVDFTGQTVDIEKIMEIAKKNNLIVIEDAAHSLGSEFKGKRVGSLAHMTTFSFHPVKTITAGEGGMITTNSKELYEKLLALRSHGIVRSKELMQDKNNEAWYYEQQSLGYNYRITDIQCALGLSQLKKIENFINRRRSLAKFYNEMLREIDGVILQREEKFSFSSIHLYVIKIDLEKFKADKNVIYRALIKENIGVNLHYVPVYLHPYYKSLGYKKGLCKNAEELYKSIITLPLHPSMDERDAEDVVCAIEKVLNYYRR